MGLNWDEWLLLQDQKIKSAQGKSVKVELLQLNLKSVPREKMAEVADLARRLNLSKLILRLLTQLMHAPTLHNNGVSDFEIALYALALARIGAYKESSEYLEKLNNSEKKILLVKASAWISQWNYKKAKSIYKTLLNNSELSPYEDKIVKINLASCLVEQANFESAVTLLQEFDGLKSSHRLLYGNSLELLAQAYFGLGNMQMAEQIINLSITLLEEADEDYSLFAKKWLSIIQATVNTELPQSWNQVRAQALKSKDYETLRDLDLYQSCLTNDKELFLKVFFGSSFSSYRKRALKKYGHDHEIPKHFFLRVDDHLDFTTTLDLETGQFSNSVSTSGLPQLQLKLLRELTRDFYRPFSVGELFSALYPDERFDIYSSPHRLFQLVRNLRKFLHQIEGSPRIEMKNGNYRLFLGTTQIKVSLNYPPRNYSDPFEKQLMTYLKHKVLSPFNRTDLQSHLGLSKTRAVEVLKVGLKLRLIRREKAGNQAWYHAYPKALKKSA